MSLWSNMLHSGSHVLYLDIINLFIMAIIETTRKGVCANLHKNELSVEEIFHHTTKATTKIHV